MSNNTLVEDVNTNGSDQKEVYIGSSFSLERALAAEGHKNFSIEHTTEQSLKNLREIKSRAMIKLFDQKPKTEEDYNKLLNDRAALFIHREVLWSNPKLNAMIKQAVKEQWSAKDFLKQTRTEWTVYPSLSVKEIEDFRNDRRISMIEAHNRAVKNNDNRSE